LDGAAETSDDVFLGGPGGVYRLDGHNRAQKIAGISDDSVITDFHEISPDHGLGRVLFATTTDLFAYSQAGVLIGVPGAKPGIIHSMHEIGGVLYALASKGVFRLDEAGKLERLKGIGTGGAIHTSSKTTKGVFVVYNDGRIYRLTDSGEIPVDALPQSHGAGVEKDEKPREWDIEDTRVGPLLATDRALYRFSEMNSWVLVPSGDLGGDVEIIPVPKIIKKVTVDVPVFVRARNGVFKWIDGPSDISIREAWNYIAIFYKEVVTIVASLVLIIWVFVYYSLYRYRWVRYYILGLLWPSRVHNQIFISYRRNDAREQAFAIYNELCHRFGRDLIFIDSEKLEYAAEFPAALRKAVEQCSGLLAIIGPNWLNAKNEDGSRRLDDPHDFVRQEIELALDHDKVVFPILRGEVTMPKARSLPESLGKLADWKALELPVLSEKNLDELVQSLFAKIRNLPPPKRS